MKIVLISVKHKHVVNIIPIMYMKGFFLLLRNVFYNSLYLSARVASCTLNCQIQSDSKSCNCERLL